MKLRDQGNRGQVLVMVTLALFAMVGMLGLAVDLGWSYFTKSRGQAGVDAASLAAVTEAYVTLRSGSPPFIFNCGTTVTCQPITQCPHPVPNPPANNIQNGCLYADRNGFSTNPNGRQNVTMQADITPNPPTAPGVDVYYWVTARAAESTPQLFSSLLGNAFTTSSARATAAIVDWVVPGSLILMNRDNDCIPLEGGGNLTCGVDLLVQANNNQGMDAVRADGGITMASTKHGVTADGRYAGENSGGGMVRAPFTFIRGDGDIILSGGSQWIVPPENGKADSGFFTDPFQGLPQPPPPTGLPDRPISGAHILGSNDPNNPLILDPGNYYATKMVNGQEVATGEALTMSGYITFSSGGTGFGNYVFFGGLRNQSAGTEAVFDPGRYVFAGVKPNGNNAGSLFDIQVNMSVYDQTSSFGPNSDAGEIFIFTDTNYPGLEIPTMVQPVASQLRHGISGFQTGNNAAVYVNLHGLNPTHPAVPADLKPYDPVIFWQDRLNSVVQYTPDGYIDNYCGNLNPLDGCANTSLQDPGSTMLFFKASPNLHLFGVAYQPRGSFTWMVGGGGYDAPLQLIAGALRVHANSNVRLRPINVPLRVKVVSLIE